MKTIRTAIALTMILTFIIAVIPDASSTEVGDIEVTMERYDQFDNLTITFEGADHYQPVPYVPEAGATFQSNWKSVNRGAFANNPSGNTILVWTRDISQTYNRASVYFDDPVWGASIYYASRYDVSLAGYDVDDNLVTIVYGSANYNSGFIVWDKIGITSDKPDISYIIITGYYGRTVIDDLTVTVLNKTFQAIYNGVEDLTEYVENLDLNSGIENSLVTKLDDVLNAFDDGKISTANKLNAFINHVEALSGKKFSESEADQMISDANTMLDHLE